MPEGEKGALRRAEEKSAEIGRLAAEAARALGCDGGLEAAETVLRAGLLKLGRSILGLLSAGSGQRGPRVPCGNGHQAEFTGYRDKTFGTVHERAAAITGREIVPEPPRREDLDYGDIDGIEAAVRRYPLEGTKKDEVRRELGYFLNNAPRLRYKWFLDGF